MGKYTIENNTLKPQSDNESSFKKLVSKSTGCYQIALIKHEKKRYRKLIVYYLYL